MRIKKIIAVFMAAVCAFFTPFVMPDLSVKASAESTGFTYVINYKADYSSVELTPSASGNYFRYTVDGKSPTAKSSLYKSALKFKSAKTLKVIEYNKSGKAVSSVVSIDVKRGCMPTSFAVKRDKKMKYTASLSTVTEGATIYYTTNGSTPKVGAKNTKKYTGEFKTALGKTIKTLVVKDGYKQSKVMTFTVGGNTVTEAAKDEDISGNYDPIISNILKEVNKERENASLYALALDATLCEAAAKRAEETLSVYDHTRPNGEKWHTVLDEYSYAYSFAAENIGYCGGSKYDDEKAVEKIMSMWMNSPVHKANILNENGTHIGIGFAKSGNIYYFVQIFGKRK